MEYIGPWFELTTSKTPPSPKQVVLNSIDIGIGYCSTRRVYWILLNASHLFRSPMKACRIQRFQVKLDRK